MASSRPSRYAASPQFRDGRFRNAVPLPTTVLSLREQIGLMWRFFFDKPSTTVPSTPLPVQPLTRAQLLAAPDRSLYRLGHSTVLMKLAGGLWLTDPVFSSAPRRCPLPGQSAFMRRRSRWTRCRRWPG